MTTAQEALQRLREGNQRFVAEVRDNKEIGHHRRSELADKQEPFAIILGCADSRVPAELVFDQGLGDLFVVRVAGNIAAPSQIGSIEFAASQFGCRLVVVLGHSKCGAIVATLKALENNTGGGSANLDTIVTRIKPAVEGLMASELKNDPDSLVSEAVKENVRAAVLQVREDSEIIDDLVENDGLLIIGAEYCLDSGAVEFFENS